jgi:proline racemase
MSEMTGGDVTAAVPAISGHGWTTGLASCVMDYHAYYAKMAQSFATGLLIDSSAVSRW